MGGGAAVALRHLWRTKGAGHKLIEGKSPFLHAALLVTRPVCFFNTFVQGSPEGHDNPFVHMQDHSCSSVRVDSACHCRCLLRWARGYGHEIPIHVLAGTPVYLCKDCKH